MCRRAQKRDFFPWQRYGCVEHPTSCREAVLLCGALPPPARGAGNAVRAGAVRRPCHVRGHLQCLRDFLESDPDFLGSDLNFSNFSFPSISIGEKA